MLENLSSSIAVRAASSLPSSSRASSASNLSSWWSVIFFTFRACSPKAWGETKLKVCIEMKASSDTLSPLLDSAIPDNRVCQDDLNLVLSYIFVNNALSSFSLFIEPD